MDIKEIMKRDRSAADTITDLMKKQFKLRPWAQLEREYNQKKHPVMDKALYPDKKKEKVTRITRGWQKLAVKRMSGLLFGTPVQRIYDAHDDEDQQKAASIMEAIFKANRIDSVNRDRCKQLYASCEILTIWYTQEADVTYAEEPSKLKLRCVSYSPMDGYELYPLFDEYNDLIALSVKYSRTEGNDTINYFETYTAEEHVRWVQIGGWQEELRESISIGKISGVYAMRPEPVWEDESDNVYEAEWALSRNGNYLRKNARPNWVVCSDEKNVTQGSTVNKDNDGVAFLHYPKDAKVGYETWAQAIDSLKFHVDTIKQNFFMQLQLPDISYENMKSAPMSGESRKMMFLDAQQKATDESGIWEEFFSREVNVVKAHMKNMYPSLSAAIDALQVNVQITPFQINDTSERVQMLSNATGGMQIMSQRTAVKRLGMVDDVEAELEQIANEQEASTSSLFNEPTE